MAEEKRPGQRQTPRTLTRFPESQRARKLDLAMPRVGNGSARQRTPLAPCRPGAPGSCGVPQGLEEAQTEGRNTKAARNSVLLTPTRGEPRHGTEGVLSDLQTGYGLTLRSCRVTSIAPRLCKSPNPNGSVAAVLADASQRSR